MQEDYIAFDDEQPIKIKIGDVMTIFVDESTEIEVEVREIKKKVN